MTRVLSIQTVLDVVPDVDLVNDLICVLLQCCSEDHDLVVLGHGLDELDATRSHEEKAVVLVLCRERYKRELGERSSQGGNLLQRCG